MPLKFKDMPASEIVRIGEVNRTERINYMPFMSRDLAVRDYAVHIGTF